jgi:cysteate synthase
MKFQPTQYQLMNVATGRVFDDCGWDLSDPEGGEPSLVRAVYAQKQFTPRTDLKGLYRYAEWMPIRRTLKHSAAPVTYKSKGLAKHLGLNNLYITFSGWNPRLGAKMQTCSFKETEAFSVCARMDKKENRVLVVQSAGNTARAFAQVCSDNEIPVVICVPQDNLHDLWFHKKLHRCVKLIAAPHGCDYYDAITLGEKLAQNPRFFLEGGAKNVARRDGMGTTVLSFVDKVGRIPDAYFQAVGSGTGAIAAWENAERLAEDGRFGENRMRVYVAQNTPFTLIHDSWKAQSRELLALDPEKGRHSAEIILAKVLANRKPPYSLAGGLFDVLRASGGDFYKVTNDELIFYLLQFLHKEGYDIFPASACAVAALAKALEDGSVSKNETVMLTITGAGMIEATSKGYSIKQPDLVLSPDLPAEEIIAAVNALF